MKQSITLFLHHTPKKKSIAIEKLQEFSQKVLQVICSDTEKGRGTHPLEELEEIEIHLINDAEIQRLHREFMGEDNPTDVITFHHGEIFISTDTAWQYTQKESAPSLNREIALYITHGLLHLHGYEDKKPSDRKKMTTLQEKILARHW